MPAERAIRLGQSRQAALWALRAVAALASASALMLFLRRMDNAYHVAPTASVLFTAGLIAIGVATALRFTSRRMLPAGVERLTLEIAASSVPWLLGAALSLPGASAGAIAGFWLLVLCEEGLAWFTLWQSHTGLPNVGLPIASPEVATADEADTEREEPLLPEGVCQQLSRSVSDDTDELSALVRVRFDCGGRTASAHVAFCPPFAAVPTCEAAVVDGIECRIKVAQVLPYGVRLELKLSEEAEQACETVLSVCAQAPLTVS